MKILKLRLRNLNSLAGEWSFDFTHPAFEQGGLMVITGPTGAGKTTILDAVCLALYGATPRLGRLSESENEIMSRGRADCSVELIFETPAGRYRCHWSQHRARKKADGKLRPPRHEIVDDVSGRVLESSLSKTLAEVEKITGMNFVQFSRSVMLAQGAFAAFLEAPAKERAGLLERITGTEIYGRISSLAYERKERENKRLEALRQKLDGLARPEGDESALAAESAGLAADLAELERELAEKRRALDWRKELAGLEAADLKLAGEQAELERSLTEFQPHKARLDLALKALSLAGEYGGLEELRRRREGGEADLAARLRRLPDLKAAEARAVRAEAEAEARLEAAARAEEAAGPALFQARLLDAKINDLEKGRAPLADRLAELSGRLSGLNRDRRPTEGPDREEGWPAELKAALEKIRAGLEERRGRLAALLAGRELSGWREESLSLSRRLDRLEKLGDDLARAAELKKDLAGVERAIERTAADLTALSAESRSQSEMVAALEQRGEDLAAVWNLYLENRSLQDRLAALAEGRPCPLCGSTRHPYARPENRPPKPPVDLEEHKVRLAEARQRAFSLIARESGLERDLKNYRESAEKLRAESGRLARKIDSELSGLGQEAAAGEADKLIPALADESRRAFKSAAGLIKDAEKLEKEMAAAESQLQSGLKVLGQAETLLAETSRLRAELAGLDRREADLRRDRAAALGRRDPDAEEKNLRAASASARKDLEARKSERAAAEKDREKLAASIADIGREQTELSDLIQTRSAGFLDGARAAGFADEAAWRAAALTEQERLELEKRFQSLTSAQAGLEARLKENQARLAEARLRDLSPLAAPELAAELERLSAGNRSILARRGVVEQKLADLRRVAETHNALRLAVEAQTLECGRWERLNKLIGSADGQKYRNFAQGLTFEMLLKQANRQLAALSDRYLLRSDPVRPLELSVMDNYQAGEIRSTKNLSGGESFLVSLALALGLAQMASRRVRVDTLFLDEGFGSLDEDTLDQALETLASLRSEGKLIGVISHIQALTDRIPTRILVLPQNGPFSRVSGPGVESVSTAGDEGGLFEAIASPREAGPDHLKN